MDHVPILISHLQALMLVLDQFQILPNLHQDFQEVLPLTSVNHHQIFKSHLQFSRGIINSHQVLEDHRPKDFQLVTFRIHLVLQHQVLDRRHHSKTHNLMEISKESTLKQVFQFDHHFSNNTHLVALIMNRVVSKDVLLINKIQRA